MPAIPARLLELSPPDRLQLEAWLAEFEEGWDEHLLAGRVGRLPPAGQPLRLPALIELVKIDLERNWQRGRHLTLADYLARYPELGPAEALPPDLLLAEEEVCRQFGEVAATHLVPAAAEAGPTLLEPPPTAAASRIPCVRGYEVLGKLGQGAMGAVYKALHLRLNRLVALKVICDAPNARPQDLARFRQEAEMIARLQHANIVQIYEVGEYAGGLYLALEYLDGPGLDRQLNRTPQPPRQAARLVEALARAVHYAHGQGVIHRDLKPANVLLTSTGTPKITDFGLARPVELESGLTTAGSIMGTPNYMAPEQAEGRLGDIGPHTDTYALGAILYECLTGRPPFRGATVLDTLVQVRQQDPVPPHRLRAKLPRDLEAITLKCLEKATHRRFASALDLAEELRRFCAGEPTQTRPPGRLEKAVKWARRKPAVAGLWAVLLAAGAAAGGTGLWLAGAAAARQAEIARGVGQDLDTANRLLEEDKLAEARATVERAEARLAGGGDSPQLRARVQQVWNDLELAGQLDEVSLRMADRGDRASDLARADAGYAKAFREHGMDVDGPEEAVAARIRERPIRALLVAALDHWANVRCERAGPNASTSDWRRLAVLAELADPDPWGRRLHAALANAAEANQKALALDQLADAVPIMTVPVPSAGLLQLRKVLVSRNVDALVKLADAPPIVALPAAHVVLLGDTLTLSGRGDKAVEVLLRAHRRHPADFWTNHSLAFQLCRLQRPRWGEAICHFRLASVALRDKNPVFRMHLGIALENDGQLKEAVDEYLQALACPDHSPRAAHHRALLRYNLGNAYRKMKRWDEAAVQYQKAIRLREGQRGDANQKHRADAYTNLGITHLERGTDLRFQGELDKADAAFGEAVGAFQSAIANKPNPPDAGALANLGTAHKEQGITLAMQARAAEATRAYQEAASSLERAIAVRNDDADAYCELGFVLMKVGKFADAAWRYDQAFQKRPALAENLGDQHRYSAACAAARAAGLDVGGASLSAEERAGWRMRALDWLRDDLDRWCSCLDRHQAERVLRHWQHDSNLAGVRDDVELAKLPRAERQAWRRLWDDVDALLDRVRSK
jgi:serine/threonine-protein kinase